MISGTIVNANISNIANEHNTIEHAVSMAPLGSPLNQTLYGPYFDSEISGNVTALVGKSAYLSCKVRNLGNKTVSNNYFYKNKNIKTYIQKDYIQSVNCDNFVSWHFGVTHINNNRTIYYHIDIGINQFWERACWIFWDTYIHTK